MSNVRYPTYNLAPNWTCHPDEQIVIGNILVDPLIPQKVLVKADSEHTLPTYTHIENNWQLALETVRSLSVSIWATFLEHVTLKIGGSKRRVLSGQFTMDSLETIYLREDPSLEYFQRVCEDPLVTKFMQPESVFCKPIYMVTGLKIARGFKMAGANTTSSSATAGTTIKGTPMDSAGAQVEASTSTAISDQFESAEDIIFAYQLLVIKPKGWWKNKKIEIGDFQKHALLRDTTVQNESEARFEIDSFGPEYSEQSAESSKTLDLSDNEFGIVHILYQETM